MEMDLDHEFVRDGFRKGILLCYAESLFVTLNVLPGADYRSDVFFSVHRFPFFFLLILNFSLYCFIF